jgi:acyl dehydratase
VFITFTEVACKFLKEVNSGDTLYPSLEITSLTPQGETGIVETAATIHNQNGEVVLLGTHKYLLKTNGN